MVRAQPVEILSFRPVDDPPAGASVSFIACRWRDPVDAFAIARGPVSKHCADTRDVGLVDVLRLGDDGIVAARAACGLDAGQTVLMVVDQLEELHTTADLVEAEAFLAALATAASTPDAGIRIVATLRADAHGRAAVLPLLQHLVRELYERRVGTRIPTCAYDDLGGVGGALAATAERLHRDADADEQRAMRRVFGALVAPTAGDDLRRRVRPTPGSQLALDVVFDYHAILTDRTGDMLEVEADHRAHAVVELAIRDLKAGGLAHVPSGKFGANAAWLGLAVLAHNLGRWTLKAAGPQWQRATVASLQTKLVAMPARLVHTGRRLKLRAPRRWPWHHALQAALVRIAAIPAPT